jgi:hypothetical protein
MRFAKTVFCGALCAAAWGAGDASAAAPREIQGSGLTITSHGAVDGGNLYEHYAINAHLNADGSATGRMTWEGDGFQPLPGRPADPSTVPTYPAAFEVTGLAFSGGAVTVTAVMVAGPPGIPIGSSWTVVFTDNDGAAPDEIDGVPVHAGNFRVR